jgi:dTDP-4-amino-4,6-dideoxygalactose transaminase
MPKLGMREWLAVGRVIAHGQLLRTNSSLHLSRHFEKELAQYVGADRTLAVSSGTAALVIALQACEVGPGDEVLVSAYAWMASAAAVLLVGAVPVLVEIDETLTMDPDDLAAKITPRSRAVIPVHMINRPCNMDRILSIAAEHDLRVVEDACQAIGVPYNGRICGTIGDIGTYSFNQAKNMTCGEGGAVLTNDMRLWERAYCAHDMGVDFRDLDHDRSEADFVGANYRISEIQGAILRIQLSKLPRRLKRMRERARYLRDTLERTGLPVAPHHDPENALSVVVTFETEDEAIAFAKHRAAHRLFDNSKHVYTRWTAILERRMATPKFDPWAWGAQNTWTTAESCPQTLDRLKRSCIVSTMPDWRAPLFYAATRGLVQAGR